jgi:hypothetical protein
MIFIDECGAVGAMIGKGTEMLGENLLRYHFVLTNLTLSYPGSNAVRRSENPATNRLCSFSPSLCSSGQEFQATDPEVRIRFPALPEFLRSSGSGTGSTEPREYN